MVRFGCCTLARGTAKSVVLAVSGVIRPCAGHSFPVASVGYRGFGCAPGHAHAVPEGGSRSPVIRTRMPANTCRGSLCVREGRASFVTWHVGHPVSRLSRPVFWIADLWIASRVVSSAAIITGFTPIPHRYTRLAAKQVSRNFTIFRVIGRASFCIESGNVNAQSAVENAVAIECEAVIYFSVPCKVCRKQTDRNDASSSRPLTVERRVLSVNAAYTRR